MFQHSNKNLKKEFYKIIYRNKIFIDIIYSRDKILDVMEDIKQNITDNEYKIIMDSLKEIYQNKEDNEVISNWKRERNILIANNENLKRQLFFMKHSININNRSEYSIQPLYL